jgi:hypothetical protein
VIVIAATWRIVAPDLRVVVANQPKTRLAEGKPSKRKAEHVFPKDIRRSRTVHPCTEATLLSRVA